MISDEFEAFGDNYSYAGKLKPKYLSPKVSNSSEIIQGSLVGPEWVHFMGSITYSGA